MENMIVEKVDLELRKIRASKLKITKSNNLVSEDDSVDHDEEYSKSIRIKVGFKRSKGESILPFFVVYEIPSYFDKDIEIEAEFIGKLHFTKSFDIESYFEEIQEHDMDKILMPAISTKVDEILEPIFAGMNIKYPPIRLSEDVDSDDNGKN